MSTTVARPRPYRRLLTSALHTRFVHASALVLLVCWNHSFFISDKNSWYFWSWFPFGPAGLRTVFIYCSALFVFILHVGTLKIGKRHTASPFDTLRRILFSMSTIQPFFWYTASAIWFSEVYIWCAPNDANLGWIVRGTANTPDKLNERPIYLRFVCLMLAVFQSCIFLYMDLSALRISIGRHRPDSKSAKQDTHPRIPIKQKLRENGVSLVIYCAAVSAAMSILGPFIYSLTLRQGLWKFHLTFAKLFWNLSRANARAVGYPPCNVHLILQSFGMALQLLSLWMATSVAFILFLDQEPVKKGMPLSTGSNDPNGTLLNGLKAKKDVVKTFAFWELASISEKQPQRRRAIFADIERPEGPCWASMQEAALNVVREIDLRISATNPAPKPTPEPQAIDSLPSIAPPVSTKQIVLNSPTGSTARHQAEALIAAGAKRIGQSQQPWSPPVDKVRADLMERAKPAVQAVGHFQSSVEVSAAGGFIVKTKERKINSIVLGAPHSQAVVIVDAISSLTKMLVASLSEDAYGKVNRGVPEVVRTFSTTVTNIENFVQSLGTRVDESEIEHVLIVHALLKTSLAELLAAFQMYLHDVGLGVSELNAAKKAAQKRLLINAPPPAEKQPDMEEQPQQLQQQQRRQLHGKQGRQANGNGNGHAGGTRRHAKPAAADQKMEGKKNRRLTPKGQSPFQPYMSSESDEENPCEEGDEDADWDEPVPPRSDGTRRKLFEKTNPTTEDWLGNSMYNGTARPRRGHQANGTPS